MKLGSPATSGRLASLVLAVALLAAACGDADDDEATGATAAATAASSPSTEAPATTAATTTSAGGEVPSTRTAEHALGTSEVPVQPERIVVLDSTYLLDNLVAFGLGDAVVGRGDFGFGEDVPAAWLADDLDLDATEFVGAFPTFNLEQIATLEPDLIISAVGATEGVADLLAEIAPTVAIRTSEDPLVLGPWQGVTRAAGAALGLDAAAEAIIGELDEYFATELSAQPEGWADRTVSIVLGTKSFGGLFVPAGGESAQFFDQAGFADNPNLEPAAGAFLSEEQYELLEADLLVIIDGDRGATDWDAELVSDPLLAALDVVQRGDVAVFEQGQLMLQTGPTGAREAIDLFFGEVPAP